jgi:predicted hydrolase (HD superfamily)
VPSDQLTKGAEELGVQLEEHVMNVAEGLKSVPVELDL